MEGRKRCVSEGASAMLGRILKGKEKRGEGHESIGFETSVQNTDRGEKRKGFGGSASAENEEVWSGIFKEGEV